MSLTVQHPYLDFLKTDHSLRKKIPLETISAIHKDLLDRSSKKGNILIRSEFTKQWYDYYVIISVPYILIFESFEKCKKMEYYSIINMLNATFAKRDSKMPGKKTIVMRVELTQQGNAWFDQFQTDFKIAYSKYIENKPTNTTLSEQSERIVNKPKPPLPAKLNLNKSFVPTSNPQPMSSLSEGLSKSFDGRFEEKKIESTETKSSKSSPQTKDTSIISNQSTNDMQIDKPSGNKENDVENTTNQENKEIKEETLTTEEEKDQEESNVIELAIKKHSTSQYVPAENDLKDFYDAIDEGKNLIWELLKQVRPGMDLSKITFPSHILEPRSFLVKTVDYFAHIQFLKPICNQDDPGLRMLGLVKWLLSGFYLMPTGIKKPYNPILGETFRTMWTHDDTSRSYLIGEQVSHHPPISAFYASNRKHGWTGNGYILFETIFKGLSAGILLKGGLDIYLLNYGEHYTMTFPEALCSGFIVGPLTMELCGKSIFKCKESGYSAEVTFNTKGTFSSDKYQTVDAKILNNGKEEYKVWGNYYKEIFYSGKDKIKRTLLKINDIRGKVGNRYTIDIDQQDPFESDKLWKNVTEAIYKGDQTTATNEKCILEENQRDAVREHELNGTVHVPKLFEKDPELGWKYVHFNNKKFDDSKEVIEVEDNFRIFSITHDEMENVIGNPTIVNTNLNVSDCSQVIHDDEIVSTNDNIHDIPSESKQQPQPTETQHDNLMVQHNVLTVDQLEEFKTELRNIENRIKAVQTTQTQSITTKVTTIRKLGMIIICLNILIISILIMLLFK
ncbi:putative Oxysterol binding protein [Entamoeba marina]